MLPRVDSPVHHTAGGVPYLRKPGVALLGTKTCDLEGIRPFLEGFDTDLGFVDYPDDPDSLPPGAQLVKFAGQLCYLSLGRSRTRNRDAQKYITHILESGHGCYDIDTDVLTAEGWKVWPDVVETDRLATLTVDGEIEYRRPVRLIRAGYTGRMYRVEGSGIDLLVTPNHNMFVCPTTTRLGRQKLWSGFRRISAEELGHRSVAYLKTGRWEYRPDSSWSIFSADEMRLLGFSIGDGHYPGSGRKVHFHLRRERKITWLSQLVGRLGYDMKVRDDHYTVDVEPLANLFRQMYTDDGDKQIPQAETILTHQSRESLEGLYEGLMQSDGHEGRTGDSFDTTSPVLVGQFQQLCLHIGLAANEGCTKDQEARDSYGSKPLTRLHVIRRILKPEINKWAGQLGRSSWVEDWSGEVFCAEMPEDTARVVYVRRCGQPVWCGNSVTEHVDFTLLAYGVSRSLTHELVRHRLASYSQVSQRYVSGTTLRFVERPEYQDDSELHDRFEKRIEHLAREYAGLTAALLEKQTQRDPSLCAEGDRRTDARKKVQQAARSCLPNETEAPIVCTFNVRMIRHLFEMRAARPAEVEIRRLAHAVFRVVKEVEPLFFADYEEEELPDGTVALTTPYRKV